MQKKTFFIFGSIFLALIIAPFTKEISLIQKIYDLLGSWFLNALMCLVIPMISTTLITGISQSDNFSKLGKKIFSTFLFSNLLAVSTAFFIFFISKSFLLNLLPSSPLSTSAAKEVHFLTFFKEIIPSNLFKAISENQILGILIFSILFGSVTGKLNRENADLLKKFFQALNEVFIKMSHVILKFLPLGIFCLIAKQFSNLKADSYSILLFYFLMTVSAFFIYSLIILPILLKLYGKVSSPYKILKKILPAISAGFFTSSSTACLPIIMDSLENRLKVPSFIVKTAAPLGTTLNLAGSAIYIYISVLTISMIYQIPLTISGMLFTAFLTFFLSFGAAGVPSAGLLTIALILKILNIPAEGIGIILAVDRILDMLRSSVNVFANTTSILLINGKEKQTILE